MILLIAFARLALLMMKSYNVVLRLVVPDPERNIGALVIQLQLCQP